ncbi:hypothetical protein QR680_012143 [Steinernema hermaphroditum]|uniref:ER membrane protein complex subunit 7 beta-sandwich domain-containing protein n=1 Tax=Steinernema hermaphroditum TaxID=289476 RepID=A0AA39I302_9BILA|nr:hypothetical protein QR680_012143 [Steinernema hermaphroditum]
MRLNRILALLAILPSLILAEKAATEQPALYTIEGEAIVPRDLSPKRTWQRGARILLDHGKYLGFIRDDGKFVVHNVPSGSYIVEVANADYVFEPVRVDINQSGKKRARRLNVLQPSAVAQIPYPLQMTARQPANYFRKREELKITDMLMNPMVLMLVVPLVLMLILPKLAANDPELQKEMQNMKLPKMDGLDMSDMLANYFGSNQPKKAIKKGGANKKTR